MSANNDLGIFEAARPMLMGIAYRMFGSYSDAEDAVQETYIKWQAADTDNIEHPKAWLGKVCTRLCIDQLKSGHSKKVEYVGPWLPEPLGAQDIDSFDEHYSLADSLSTAFMLMLDRLNPRERAAFLLREVFDYEYHEVSDILGIKEPTCRKLVSRAKKHLKSSRQRHSIPEPRKLELITAFQTAIQKGNAESLERLLSDDIEFISDGGGKVPAVRKILTEKWKIQSFLVKVLTPAWQNFEYKTLISNGNISLIVEDHDSVYASISFEMTPEGQISGIYIMRNPDKLGRL